MADLCVHVNGDIVPAAQAAVSVYDSGLLHGASVFTTMLAHNGRVFRLDRHIKRLLDTAAMLDFRVEATTESLTGAVHDLLQVNELTEARMRITLTPGSIAAGRPTTFITADPLPEYPRNWYEKGITVVVTSFKQAQSDPTYGNKTGSYLTRMLARQEALAKSAEEALWYTPDNRLAEACFCNVFLVLDGKVCTPPRDTPVLPGIVRQAVLEICQTAGIPADDASPLTVKEMLAAREMFLTSSTSGIRPVVRVERHGVGDEKPGPVTRKIMEAYRELLDKECSA
jgi:branched-chain amino acid aminotransferase